MTPKMQKSPGSTVDPADKGESRCCCGDYVQDPEKLFG